MRSSERSGRSLSRGRAPQAAEYTKICPGNDLPCERLAPIMPGQRGANRIDPKARMMMQYPVTPDGRYIVVRGRLWRRSNPALSAEERDQLTHELMKARQGVRHAKRVADTDAERQARRRVHEVKVALGERGSVWWSDGAPDFNRYLVKNTPYRSWYSGVSKEQ